MRARLRLYSELLPDQERVLGRDHPDTLRTRSNIAALDRRGGRCARDAAAVPRAAAGYGAGAGAQSPRHTDDA